MSLMLLVLDDYRKEVNIFLRCYRRVIIVFKLKDCGIWNEVNIMFVNICKVLINWNNGLMKKW